MKQKEVLEVLQLYKRNHAEEFGIIRIGIFSSVAQGKETEQSDVVIETKHPNLFKLSRIRLDLEELMHTHVDLISYRESMNTFLKERIQKEAIYA